MLPQVVRGSSGDCALHSAERHRMRLRSPSRHDVFEQSRRKRSCSDYAKFGLVSSVDKRGGTLRYNKNSWIKSARFGSNRSGRGALTKMQLKLAVAAPKPKVLLRQPGVVLCGGKGYEALNPEADATASETASLSGSATNGETSARKLYAASLHGRWIAHSDALRFS